MGLLSRPPSSSLTKQNPQPSRHDAQPTSTIFATPRPFRAPQASPTPQSAAREEHSGARDGAVCRTPSSASRVSLPRYVPAKGRSEDAIRESACAAQLARNIYPSPKKKPRSENVNSDQTNAKETSPSLPENSTNSAPFTNSNLTPSPVPTASNPAPPEAPSAPNHEAATNLPSRLPLSLLGKLYFGVELVSSSSSSSSTPSLFGILVISTDPHLGAQLYDCDGRRVGSREGAGYPLPLSDLEKLVVGHTLSLGSRRLTLSSALPESEFRTGAFFLDSQRKAKQRQQEALQATLLAVRQAQTQHLTRSKLLSVLAPLGAAAPVRKGLRGSAAFAVPFKGAARRDPTGRAILPGTALVPLHDPAEGNAVTLYHAPYKTDVAGRALVSVVVDPRLGSKLRPHQVAGVQFLYDCVTGARVSDFHGCILADEMGLGKSLQAVSLIWTCLRQGMYGRPVTRRAVVVAPCSLVANWQKEFVKWLGEGTVKVCAIAESTPRGERILSRFESEGDVLVISYDQLRKYVSRIRGMKQVELVVCDEGHKLKNAEIKTTQAVSEVSTKRRVILSGTPIQNDLTEFHAMVSFVNPGILGSLDVFCRVFQEPIARGREPNCEEEEKLLGQERAQFLSTLTRKFILRRTQVLNEKYLPAKVEMTVFCHLTASQKRVYQKLVERRSEILSHQPFASITALRQLSNHTSLLLSDTKSSSNDEGFELLSRDTLKLIRSLEESEKSAKCNLLLSLIHQFRMLGDKLVVVSNFTSTLELIAAVLKSKRVDFFQLDGSTPIKRRQELVDLFNIPSARESVFLLSSKAGGVGLNLVGANRLVLFDPDWNPANDAQAMGRVWRDGQKKTVYIYRLLSTGTIEEKIFMRQVSKQGLSNNIVDANMESKQHFTLDDLRTLFTYNTSTRSETHDLLNCTKCGKEKGGERVEAKKEKLSPAPVRFKALKSAAPKCPRMDEIREWAHLLPSELEDTDRALSACGRMNPDLISLVFSLCRDQQKLSGAGQVEAVSAFPSEEVPITVEPESDIAADIEFTQQDDDEEEES